MRTWGAHPNDWTDERSALLRRLWDVEGLSAGDIAAKIGLSRNAVIGRVHRMKLKKRKDKRENAKKANATKLAKGQIKRVSSMTVPAAPAEPDTGWKEAHLDFEPRGLIEIWDLNDTHCRWPYDGEPRTTYCGRPKVHGSYCRKHFETGTEPKRPLTRLHPSLYK